MKLLVNGNQEIASLDISVDSASGLCKPAAFACGYRVEGPEAKMAFVSDKETGGLRLDMELPGVIGAALLVEKEDVKKLKGLMNKDAIKFVIKSFM